MNESCQNCKMSTLIGVADIKITDKHATNYQTNKTGGIPDFYRSQDVPFPICPICGKKLHLIVQLYCPLDGYNFHRTLYIFACSTVSCLNKPESWLVYRCQSEVKSAPQTVTGTPSPSTFDDNWGDDCDDWGGGADDWGTSHSGTCINVDILGATQPAPQNSETDNWGTSNDATKKTATLQDNSTIVQCSEDVPDLGTMCIEDSYDSDDSKGDNHVISEDIHEVTDDIKSQFLTNIKHTSGTVDSGGAVLESYFINVFDDNSGSVDKDDHVNRLLRDYERKEGQIGKGVSMETESSAGGDGEKYEKTRLKHGDVYFHKFMKQIAMCHEQCIRYCWNGSPLYLRAPPSHPPNICTHCNGDLVFELQLMPALVNLLKFTQDADPSVEFGTVLIFTCRKSCWTSGEHYRTEQLIVQSDPDQERFK